jgi:hypothetical protein
MKKSNSRAIRLGIFSALSLILTMRDVSFAAFLVCALITWPAPAAPGGVLLDAETAVRAGMVANGSIAPASAQKKSKAEQYAESFLLYGNVYTDQGLALPGAEVKVRREDQKKPKWESNSDDRGEFAIRVAPGPKYEITIKAKGYEPLTRMVDTWQQGNRVDLAFKMQRAAGGKK